MDEKRAIAGPIVAAILLLLPGLYVGAYVVTVERGLALSSSPPSGPYEFHHEAFYSINGEDHDDVLGPLFYPVHQIDRWLRPSYWKLDPERIGVDFNFNIDSDDDAAEPASLVDDDVAERPPAVP